MLKSLVVEDENPSTTFFNPLVAQGSTLSEADDLQPTQIEQVIWRELQLKAS